MRAVSDEVPVPLRSVRFPSMLLRLLLRLLIYALRVLSPVKKDDPLVVTLPFKRSSIKMADEQPRFLIAGPKVLTFVKPILYINYHKLKHLMSHKEPLSEPLLANKVSILSIANLQPFGSIWRDSSMDMCNSSTRRAR